MRILIAPNAFKGTLTAKQAAAMIARGLRRQLSNVELIERPIADGGDGFVGVLAGHFQARRVRRRIHDPLGMRIYASFALSANRSTAIIELASGSGLALLKRRDPMRASTCGTGELIGAAIELGARRILVGIGGSASTDGGMGLARALGAKFLDTRGGEVEEGGAGLTEVARVELAEVRRRLKGISIEVACDVTNPLHGARGAAYTFGPQKGATAAQVRRLDEGLKHLARVIRRDVGVDVQAIPGAGAAGGTGAGLAAFCGARLVGGFDLVARVLDLKGQIAECDVVVTGEGRLDHTTLDHKAPAGVMRMAREAGVPAIAVCGSVARGAEKIGFDAVFEAKNPRGVFSVDEALARGAMRAGEWIRENLVVGRGGVLRRR